MSPSNLDGRGREYNREDTSTEARLTAAAEVRLGDRSKRWEADAADTLCSARLVRSGDDSTSPSAASLRRA